MMIALVLVGLLSVAWLSILDWQWRRGRGSAQYVLTAFPIALLFLTIPPSTAVVGFIRGFQRVAEQGLGGAAAVSPLCLAIWRSLWFGGLGFLLAMGVAAALQIHRTRLVGEATVVETVPAAPSLWSTLILAGSSLLIVPVGIYVHRSEQLPKLVMRAAESAQRMERLTSTEIGQLSRTIASQSILAVVIGAGLSLVFLAWGLANLLAASRRHSSDRLWWYSWAVLIVSCAVVCWGMIRASADRALFETALR